MSTIKLIVGLGNPGPQYSETRHNAGAWFVAQIAKDAGVELKVESKFHGLTAKVVFGSEPVYLLIPQTFMNRSGQAVQALANFYKIKPEEILVAHDELDFEAGTCRLKLEGGHGGHNGLRDIIQKLGGAKTFVRLRIGIGHPGDRSQVHAYVLKKPSKQDLQNIEHSIYDAQRSLNDVIIGNFEVAMNQLHSTKE